MGSNPIGPSNALSLFMNLHDHFKSDHAKLRNRVAEVQAIVSGNDPARLEEIFLTLQREVRAHLRKEDDVYYPHVDAGKKIADRELIHSLRNDHAAVIFTLESLAIRLRKKVPVDEWKTKFDGMIAVLLAHFDHEEKALFPEVDRLFKPAELQKLFDKIKGLE
jgi:iron-sulfur cluster repair protein YtfE (RIC family)